MASHESSKRLRGCLGRGGCLLAVIAMVVLVPAILLLTWSSRASRRAEAELAKIRAAGEPTTPAELETLYGTSSAEQDRAGVWLAAIKPLEERAFYAAAKGLPIVGDREAEIPPPGQPWPDLEAAEKLLQQYEGSLRQLHAAAELGGPTRYPTDFSHGVYPALEHMQAFRGGASLLALEAHVRAHQGDARRAAESIQAIFMLADSLKQEPTNISLLVRKGVDTTVKDVLQRQLPVVDFSDEDLDRIQTHLRVVDYSEGLRRAMIGERVMGIIAIKDPRWKDSSGERPGITRRLFAVEPSLTVYLQYMSRIIAAAKPPWPQARRQMAQIRRGIQGASSGGSALAKPGHVMVAWGVCSHADALDAIVRGTASNRATDAVIGVERLRREKGRLPEKLDELVPKFLPQVPVDPFDGQPLRYVVRNDEYIIYSVGKDGVDNGGQGDEAGEPDLVFPVERRQIEP